MRRSLFLASAASIATLSACSERTSADVGLTCLPQMILDRTSRLPGLRLSVRFPDHPGRNVEHFGDAAFPAASLVKVAIALSVLRRLSGPTSLQGTVVAQAGAFVAKATVLEARIGQHISYIKLLRAMLESSDNLAANILLLSVGVEEVNRLCNALGMHATRLYDRYVDKPHGRPIAATTANNMTSMMATILASLRGDENPSVSQFSAQTIVGALLQQKDGELIPAGIPRGYGVANKTGQLTVVRSDTAIVGPYNESPFVLTLGATNLLDYDAVVAAMRDVATLSYALASVPDAG